MAGRSRTLNQIGFWLRKAVRDDNRIALSGDRQAVELPALLGLLALLLAADLADRLVDRCDDDGGAVGGGRRRGESGAVVAIRAGLGGNRGRRADAGPAQV